MKLNNKNIWVTGNECEFGNLLGEIGILDIHNHKQAMVYYEEGLTELDAYFAPEGYIKKGYVCSFNSYKAAIAILFSKYTKYSLDDFGAIFIERSKILHLEKFPADNLTIVKREDLKHRIKYTSKQAFGLVGGIVGLLADKVVSANTEIVKGHRYKLFYKDQNDKEQYLMFYSSDEFKHKFSAFLSTHYKP